MQEVTEALPSLQEMEFEVRQRVALLSEEERRKVTHLLLTVLRCYGPEAKNSVAFVTSDGVKLDIVGVNLPAPQTANLVATAYAVLNESYGITATFDASREYLQ